MWPVYAALYKGKGALTGPAQFLSLPASDVAATDLLWFNPGNAKAARYPNGWPSLFVNLTGSLFSLPPKGTVASVLPGLAAVDPAGNADFRIKDGDLTAGTILVPANVDPKNKVQFITPPAGLLPKLTISLTGLVTGSFVHPDTHKVVIVKGVVLQKLQQIDGYFPGPDQVGSVRLAPN